MMRLLYRFLVALHPPAFRRQFSPEMQLIFEESSQRPRLFYDVLLSILRQWLFRSGLWIVILAALGGAVPLLIGLALLRFSRRWYTTVYPADPLSFILATALIATFAIALTLTLAIVWFRVSRRRLRA